MREILFRGKTDKGIWVQGTYYHQAEFYGEQCSFHYIIESCDELEDNMMCVSRVDPDTVGQYTGLTDKNGTKIFEGDIVKHHRTLWGADNSDVGTIQWCQKTCKFCRTSKFDTVHIVEIWEDTANEYEVIGNIHDNPELLESEVDTE